MQISSSSLEKKFFRCDANKPPKSPEPSTPTESSSKESEYEPESNATPTPNTSDFYNESNDTEANDDEPNVSADSVSPPTTTNSIKPPSKSATTKTLKKKTKVRRGGKNKNRNSKHFDCNRFIVYLTNIQSARNRMDSLKSIVDTRDVDLVIVNETHNKKNDKFSIEGYKSFSRNRINNAMGGIASSVKNKHATYTLKISEGKNEEYLITVNI